MPANGSSVIIVYHFAVGALRLWVATAFLLHPALLQATEPHLQGIFWTVNLLSFIISTPYEVC